MIIESFFWTIIESFLENDDNIIFLRTIIEIISLGTMIVSFFVVLHISRLELAWLSSKIFNQSRYDKTNIIFGFSLMRRFQQAQNRKNPITGCGEIDRRRSTLHKIIFLYICDVDRFLRSQWSDFCDFGLVGIVSSRRIQIWC